MAVSLKPPGNLKPVKGVRLASCYCGIKKESVDDLVLFEINEQATIASVFTKNKFCAAPVTIAKQHLNQTHHPISYLLINSGNANAGTGELGLKNALRSCSAVADHVQKSSQSVLPFSTGVIGEQLHPEKIGMTVPELFKNLSEDNWLAAAKGIMTTDTLPKAVSKSLLIEGKTVTITGICKGSGMIKPDMATMLAFIATDAEIDTNDLNKCLQQSADITFNAITVDGDTSTNDACVLIATGRSGCKVDCHHQPFITALTEVFIALAQSIVRDGEGATKFIEINARQCRSKEDAKELAYTIAHSPLVKTALFASDANWGRILAAIGRAPIEGLNIDKVDLYLGDVCLIEQGLPHKDYSEEKGQRAVSGEDIKITVNLNLGDISATVWTTDLSYDYIKINAEYRS